MALMAHAVLWEPACTHLQLAILGQQQLVYAAELPQELFVGCAW